MSELKQKLLLYELSRLGFRDAVYINSSDKIKIEQTNDRMPFINDVGDISYGTEYDSLAVNTLRPIVDGVNEVAAAWEHAKAVPVDDVSRFRVLAEYNRVILAARDDTTQGRGLHYVTWQYNPERSGVAHGHYTEDYFAAKEDFAVRSGLMPEVKLFTNEQAAELKASVEYRIANDGEISYATEELLKEIVGQFDDAYSTHEAQGKAFDLSEMAKPSAVKPKSLAEKLHAAGEKAKAQDSYGNNEKTHKREERE